MKSILYLTLYEEPNLERRKELEICFQNNLLAGYDEIWFLVEEKDISYLYKLIDKQIIPLIFHLKLVEQRPSVNEYIKIANTYPETILHGFCNADIFIEPSELQKIKNLPWHKKLAVCLSRWDITQEGCFLLDRPDTSDTVFWVGNLKGINMLCPWGFAGADNRLAFEFKNAGYNVVNPSRDIVTKHLHKVKINNYRDKEGNVKAEQICPEPYSFHPPIFSNQI